jgi:hypothetical protein
MEFIAKIQNNNRKFDILSSATTEEIKSAEEELNYHFPKSYYNFLNTISNGLGVGDFKVLPVVSKSNLKKTGDSVTRHNNPKHSMRFNRDVKTIENFVVFAVEESYACYAFKKDSVNDYVWYWTIDNDSIDEIDMTFEEWLAQIVDEVLND